MSGAVSRAAKPQLKRLLHDNIKRNLYVSIASCIVAGISFHFLVNEPAKERYAKFYSQYDIEKDFVRMKNLGLFESCGPSD